MKEKIKTTNKQKIKFDFQLTSINLGTTKLSEPKIIIRINKGETLSKYILQHEIGTAS